MPKPVVAAVDGNAAGAGMNLALACDVRLGTERTVFTESFVRIGLIPDWGGLHSFVRLVGAGRAADLMMTGDRLRAERAEAIGVLQRVYPSETFVADALAYTTRLAEGPRVRLAVIKAALQATTEGALEAVLTLEQRRATGVVRWRGLSGGLARVPPERDANLRRGLMTGCGRVRRAGPRRA